MKYTIAFFFRSDLIETFQIINGISYCGGTLFF